MEKVLIDCDKLISQQFVEIIYNFSITFHFLTPSLPLFEE
ncbi:hypothetical protein EC2730350_0290 [Escherichia coli 2730350]|nr:hypothetical protein EC3431_0974 [Escherichia coli 3431]EIE38902.1 hypothetical protein OQE_04430 [Escherichia coli J53]EMV53363.1 hypothetical protein EC2871950_3861 [Escherichia coli 2871950]ENA87642.1 hypothetical protein EC2730350_0290 [Escherichia coli 2730350]